MTEFIDADFCIRKRAKKRALSALLAAFEEAIEDETFDEEDLVEMIEADDFFAATTVEDALAACGWDASTDLDGDITGISFVGEEMGVEAVMFRALAPYVESGSWVDLNDTEEGRVRLIFEDGEIAAMEMD